MSTAKPWMLPKITDYLDSETDAIQRFAAKLGESTPPKKNDLAAIREAVSDHTRALPLKWLWTVSYVFADDLYKTGNSLPLLAEQHTLFVEASAGTFFQHFHEKGYVLRYFINNSFEPTEFGMRRPLYLLPALFSAARLVYICPETLSLSLMERDGIPGSEFLKNYARYEQESRYLALKVIKKCNQMRKSYVALEMGDGRELLDETSDSEANAVVVFRSEAPVAGSKISILSLPKEGGGHLA